MKRRNIFQFLVVIFSLVLLSCEREDNTDIKPSILDELDSDPALSTLASAVDRAGLRQALAGTQYTLFAPTNDAFTAAGINPSQIDPAALLKVLQYHMIPSRVDSSRFNLDYGLFFGQIAGPSFLGQLNYQGFQTLNLGVNSNIYVTNATEVVTGNLTGRGLFINGAQITGPDAIEGGDGVVHKINRVLLPPSGSLAATVAADADLSLFNKLINKAATAPGAVSFAINPLSVLPTDALATSRAGSFTLFAPTNAAMEAAGYNDAFIDGATPAALLAIARQHTISLRNFTSDFFNQAIRPTPQLVYATLQTSPAFSVTYNAGTGAFSSPGTPTVNITGANVVTTNGVLQKVDAAFK